MLNHFCNSALLRYDINTVVTRLDRNALKPNTFYNLGLQLDFVHSILQSACSSVPEAERTDQRDPYEGVNRGAFAFNMGLDTHVLEPAASAYKNTMPKTGQRAIENHLDWTGLPATTFNSTLQGRYENASVAFLHFAVNGFNSDWLS